MTDRINQLRAAIEAKPEPERLLLLAALGECTNDPVDWDKVHDGEADEDYMLRVAEGGEGCEGVAI